MNTRTLNQMFAAMNQIAAHQLAMETDPVYRGRLNAEFAAEREARAERAAAREAREKQQMKDDAAYFTSEDFKQEVIAELVKEGATLLQAQGRTRDQFHLFREAREIGLM